MRRHVAVGVASVLMACCIAAVVKRTARSAGPPKPTVVVSPADKLVVHEWGTFTGFAGADGVHLPFNTIVGSDLPAFVMNRQKDAERTRPELKEVGLFTKGGGAAALQRMETPVIYFYADVPRELDVRVDFTKGLLTEFYPPVRKMGPDYGNAYGEYAAATTQPADNIATQKIGTVPAPRDPLPPSFLDWGHVRIVPHPAGNEGKLVPAVAEKLHYGYARDTDAALVQLSDAGGKPHEEKFLFYRGLGNFTLPVKLVAQGGDQFQLGNTDASPIPVALLMEIDRTQVKPVRFARYANVAGQQAMTLPTGRSTQAELSAAIKAALVSGGLFEKEADAMIATWEDSWLNEPGTRVLYLVPRSVTDSLLPLHVTPTPDETVRVLVGRIDVLTPEKEARLSAMMRTAPAEANLSPTEEKTLDELGRFVYPALEHISAMMGDSKGLQLRQLQNAYYRTQRAAAK